MATPAGSLEVIMFSGIARLQADMAVHQKTVSGAMKNIEGAVGTAKSVLASLGIGFGIGYFVSFIKGTNDAVASMKDFAIDAGTTAERISRFEAPARSAGLGMENVAAAIFKLSKAAQEAKDPTSKAAQALNAIGISTEQLKGMKSDEMFELIARQSVKYSDGLAKNAVMMELVGKSGREMNRLAAEIEAQGKLTATVTEEQAEAAKHLNDQMLEMKMNSEKVWRGMVADGVPALNGIIKAFIEAKQEGGWFSGVVAAMSNIFEQTADTRYESLVKLNQQIQQAKNNVGSAKVNLFLSDDERAAGAAKLNRLLGERKILQDQIWQAEFDAQLKRQMETKPGGKNTITFDPVAVEKAAKLELHFMKLREEAQERAGKLLGEFDQLNLDHYNGLIKKEQEWQDMLGKMDIKRLNMQAEAEAEADKKIADQLERNKKLGHELGMTFSSAFEDAIVKGSSFRDVLHGIEQDLLRIAVRKAVTEPAANYLGALFTGMFAGSFATGTDYVPRTGLALVHEGERITPAGENSGSSFTVNQSIRVGGNVTQADIPAILSAAKQGAVAAVIEMKRRDPAGALA